MAKKKQLNTEEPLGKKLWKAGDKLRKNMDAAEYKHIVLYFFQWIISLIKPRSKPKLIFNSFL